MAASNEKSADVIYWVVLIPHLANFVSLGYLSRRGVKRRSAERPDP